MDGGPPKPCGWCRPLSIFWTRWRFAPTTGQVQCHSARVSSRVVCFMGLTQLYPRTVQVNLRRSAFAGEFVSEPCQMASPLSEQLTGVQPSACKPSLLSIYLVWSGPGDPGHAARGRGWRSIVYKLAPGNPTRRRPWGALVELLWKLSNEHPLGKLFRARA